jgi:soluble cytochrome b562
MNGNRFFVDPLGGYGKEIVQGLSGLGSILAESREIKKKQALMQEAQDIFASNDPNKIAEFSLRSPEMAQQVSTAIKFKNDQTKQNMLDSMRRILSGEDPRQVIVERAKMVQEQGGDPIDTLNELAIYDQDPEAYKGIVANSYAWLDPQGFQAYRQATAGQKGEVLTGDMGNQALAMFGTSDVSRLSPQQRMQLSQGGSSSSLTGTQKDYQLAKQEGFEGSFIDYQKALKGGPDSDVKTMMLQTQLLDLQDRIQERQNKEIGTEKKEKVRANSLVRGIDSVIEEVDKAVKIAKEGALATGIPGAVTSKVPGSPAYNLRKILDTVKANLGFDRLQQMRDASPTGGALGSITERELERLEATVTNLDPNMGDEELIQGLEKVKGHYDAWRNAVIGVNAQQKPGKETPKFNNTDYESAAKKLSAQLGRKVTADEVRQKVGM